MVIFGRFFSALLSTFFSSEEVREMEELLRKNGVEESRLLKFLDGFNLGLGIGKKIDELGIPKNSIFGKEPVDMDFMDMQVREFSHPDNFYNFGMAFGYIIAILKFHPLYVLDKNNAERFISILGQIKKEKTKGFYYDFLRQKILLWHDPISKARLESGQEANLWAILRIA